jgi:hypothetical protein
MDYSKSGNPRVAKNEPKNKPGRGLGAEKSPTGGRASKEELLAKLKAIAEAKKAEDKA